MDIVIRYTFKRVSDGKIYQNVCPIECIEGKGDTPFVLEPDESNWDLIGRDLYTGLRDKNLNQIFANDIVEGYVGWMKGDGRLRKGFPDKVRKRLHVVWSEGKGWDAGFQLDEIGVHPDDKKANDEYFYRSIQYHLTESRECHLKDNEIVWLGRNDTLEVIGNIYENK